MEKLAKLVLSVFIAFVISILNPQLVLADNVPVGIRPVQVTAQSPEMDILGKMQFVLTFWNVGQLSDNTLYHEAVLTGKCIEPQSADEWKCVGDEEENSQKGTFSGGPNGTFIFKDYQFPLKNGKTATVFSQGLEIVFTVQNADAFNGWDDLIFDEKTALDPSTETNAEGKIGMIDSSDVSITNIIGDVGVSDPSLRRGLFDQSVNAIKVLTGWNKDPEPWRVRVDATNGTKLKKGFQMKTGEGSAVIQFGDGTKFIMKEYSTITFDHTGFNLDTGTTIFSFHKVGKKIYVTDKRGKFSIIGTQFEVSTGKDNTLLKVYEGTVETETLKGTGKTLVNAGEQTRITDNGVENKTVLSGEKTIDMQMIEKEIIAGEKTQAGKFIFTRLGAITIGIIFILGIIFVLRKKLIGQKINP